MADHAVRVGPPAAARELPAHPERDRRRRHDRLRGGPSRLRLPRREPGVRRGVRRQRPRLRRAARGRDGDDGRQDLREAGDARAPTSRPCPAPRARRPSPRRARAADEIGYPILLKASAGGGGKGMRLVQSSGRDRGRVRRGGGRGAGGVRRPAALRREGASLRRVTSRSRCSCDHYGNVLTLGERECSIQRRHQKLIEESPSAALTPETREEMEAAAERACRAVGYRNAGTFEFLLGPDGSFYFIELNARLQVEHPGDRALHGHRHRARAAARRRRRGGLGSPAARRGAGTRSRSA